MTKYEVTDTHVDGMQKIWAGQTDYDQGGNVGKRSVFGYIVKDACDRHWFSFQVGGYWMPLSADGSVDVYPTRPGLQVNKIKMPVSI